MRESHPMLSLPLSPNFKLSFYNVQQEARPHSFAADQALSQTEELKTGANSLTLDLP